MCLVSDYYQLDELLTTEEKDVRARVREFAEKHIAPIITKVILKFLDKIEQKQTYLNWSLPLVNYDSHS